ncbi:MAG TPA: HAD-IA family hydrolase [Terriglobales bacterium]|nr:HAD-IA family hydrolase [Terriglobales bacterium]
MITVHRPIPAEQIRLLIFDLDGTLIDSQIDLANSVNAMLRHFGRQELSHEVIATYIGDGAPMLIRRALGDPDDGHYMHKALDFFLHYYREHKLDNTTLYPGIREALEALRWAGNGGRRIERQFAVLSNKPVGPSTKILEGLGIRDLFVQVYGGNSFPTKKPDPMGANAILEETGTRPEEAIIIGDSEIDVITGRNAGTWCCGVTYGFRPDTLKVVPPDVVIDHPRELPLVFSKDYEEEFDN